MLVQNLVAKTGVNIITTIYEACVMEVLTMVFWRKSNEFSIEEVVMSSWCVMKRWTKDRVGKIRVFLVFEDLFVDVGICKFFFFLCINKKGGGVGDRAEQPSSEREYRDSKPATNHWRNQRAITITPPKLAGQSRPAH